MSESPGNAEKQSIVFVVYLIITTMVCGAQVMVVEVLGSRVIGPFFGVSLFVWTSLITVTLVALALGYAVGGIVSDKKESPDYLYGIIFLAGLFVLLIPPFKSTVLRACLPLGLRLGSFVSSTVLFGPSLFLLGCVSPYIIKVAAREIRNIGRTVGIFYSLSTVGSFVGTVLTGFFLIAYFGVNNIFVVVGGILIALTVIYFLFFRKKWYVAVILIIPFLFIKEDVLVSKVLPSGTKVNEIASKDSFYGNIKVVDYKFSIFDSRELVIDGLVQGIIDKNTRAPLHSYLYLMNFLPYGINPEGKSCLVIGLGAGIVPMMYEKRGIRTDVVDIDPVVVEFARKYFGFNVSGSVDVSDARYYLIKSEKKYDYLLLDVYTGDTTPGHVLSLEAFELMKQRMTDRGIMAINFMGSLKKEPFVTASVVKTLNEVFETVEIYLTGPLEEAEEAANIIILAYDFPEVTFDREKVKDFNIHSLVRIELETHMGKKYTFPSDVESIVLSDDYNPIELFGLWQKEELRKEILDKTDTDILL